MIDRKKFEELATAAKEAEAVRVERETEHAAARKALEDAARVAAEAQGELRHYVEQVAGLRLK